ncbi:MAG: methyltransferase domain-containing protein [Verrucomicrobia bacterium]|nr:methyltransferase domain-containing protein [Verrucomicrobiota bacterium]
MLAGACANVAGAMANRYYAADERRADKVRELFGAIAPRYDLINDLQSFGLHRLWKRRLGKLANVQRSERALDLCCGTGDVVFQLAKSAGFVVGLDFSLPMLKVAQERARRPWAERHLPLLARDEWGEDRGEGKAHKDDPPLPSPLLPSQGREGERPVRTHFLRSDALRIPCQDAQFDVVTISYGLRNLENFQAGLDEMGRVLKLGGRLLVLDFGKPDNAVWRKIYFGYLRWCVPWFGRLFCGDRETYAYILESLLHYPGQRGIADLMARENYSHVRVINLLGGIMSINCGTKAAA